MNGTISFNGLELKLSEIPEDIRDLITIRTKWEDELGDARVEVYKLEAAVMSINREIKGRLTAFIEAQGPKGP